MNYKVLWIDDQHETFGQTLVGDALDHGIILDGHASVEEGFDHLRRNLASYDAILLDAVSFERKGQQSGTEHERALDAARDEISALKHEKAFPYFVLTGQESKLKDQSFVQRYEGKYFDKGANPEILFDAIKEAIAGQPERQLRTRYHLAFAACQDDIVSEKAGRLLFKVLSAIQQPGSNHDDDTHFNTLRQIVEEIFRAAHRHQLLPDACITATGVNLANSSKILSGTPVPVSDTELITPTAPPLPKVFKSVIRACTELTNNGSHTDAPNDSSQLRELRETVQTPYLLASLTYQVLDLLVWFRALVTDAARLTAHQNAWRKDPINSSEEYVPGTITQVLATRGVFVADGSVDQTHIHQSTLQEHSLREGMRVEAVLKPNPQRPGAYVATKIKVV